MIKDLIKKITELKGSTLAIGIENDKVLTALDNNSNIELGILSKFKKKKFKSKMGKGNKKINVKRFRKKFKKKKTDYLIVEIDSIYKFLRYFIRDSVYMNSKETIYFGNSTNIDLDLIVKRYKRYNVKIDLKKYNDEFILIIDNTESKNHYFKDKWYFITDSFYIFFDSIGDLLTS